MKDKTQRPGKQGQPTFFEKFYHDENEEMLGREKKWEQSTSELGYSTDVLEVWRQRKGWHRVLFSPTCLLFLASTLNIPFWAPRFHAHSGIVLHEVTSQILVSSLCALQGAGSWTLATSLYIPLALGHLTSEGHPSWYLTCSLEPVFVFPYR